MPTTPRKGNGLFALRAARLFDGISASPLRWPLVVIDHGRITEVCGSGTPGPDVEVFDLGDVTLLPGLIDCHQHLVFDATDDPVGHLADRDDGDVLELARAAARSALAAGITTVRDLGDRSYVLLALRDELAGDPSAGPGLLVAGPPITTPGGHCWFLGGQAEGVDGVRAAVREHAERGVDVIKVMVTGGGLTVGSVRHESQYGPAELLAIADEAHRLGLSVTGHAQSARGIAEAVAAGFDGIEHCLFLTPQGVSGDPVVIEAMAAAGTYVSVTAAFKDPAEEAIRDPALVQNLQALVETFAAMRAAGIRLVMSSDAGVSPSLVHDGLPYGVGLLSLIGMSAAEALAAVTSVAAAACGAGDTKGRIAAGYDADLLAVGGDPLADATDLRKVAAVYRSGIRVG
jgi:imidazolonepropionase-like amidohydrolase